MTSPGHYGEPDENDEAWRDSEGNEAHPLFPWDEWWNLDEGCETLNCGDCHGEIDRVHVETCEENGGEEPCELDAA